MFNRLLSAARDLWMLLTKGQPVDDPFLPWRMAVEFAKLHIVDEDIDAWEGCMYALPGNYAFWFAHDRYAGTPYDWPRRPIEKTGLDLLAIQRVSNASAQQAYGQYVNGLQNCHSILNPYRQQAANSLGNLLGF